MASLTLLDWSRRVGPDGSIDEIAELLSQCNEVFKDMIWREGNLPTGHKSTVRTGLPTGTWRALNMGVAYSKSTTAQLESGVGQLSAWSQVDKTLADLEGQTGELRMSEDNAFLEGMSQTMATTIFYGNQATTPTQFTGFSPNYNTTTTTSAQSARNVMDGAGTGSNNTSIWLVGWGDQTCFGIFPKGTRAGLIFEDRGDVVPAYDTSTNPYRAYTSYFEWNAGLFIKDWRYICRLANIDVTSAGLAGASPPDLFQFMSKMVVRLPTMTKRQSGITETDAPSEPSPGINPAFYCNRTGREYLDVQAIRDRNVLLTPKEYAGEPVVEFRGIPIRVNDALLNTESRIT
jgi:hypothetical protein